MSEATGRLRVLITGAGGRIGSSFRRYAGERFAFRLAERPGKEIAEPAGHEVIELQAADLAACRAACEGIDVVLHLAADPSPSADFYESLLDNNFKGTYNIFRAAKDAGCQRVIFASSVHAIEGYPRDRQLTPDDPARPRNMYGASKAFGESVAHVFAVSEGLPCVCMRIGAYESGPRRERGNSTYLSMFTSQRDLNSLILRAIEEPLPDPADGAVVVHATSDNRFKRLDLTKSRQVLGYAPQDDGFQLIPLDETDEWG
jgi:NAD+ dependent glucose-6-phosphate dehydrogenase